MSGITITPFPGKRLRVTMPNGQRYDVPASVIAHNRAEYYASLPDADEDTEDEEYRITMEDDRTLMDWAANSMNWSDVADRAVFVAEAEPTDFQEGWMNGEKEVLVLD